VDRLGILARFRVDAIGELVNYMAGLPRDTIVCISTPDGLRPVTSIDQQLAVTGLSQTSRVVVLATEVSE
jgi:hypothetical protein